jgi:hypothetical protein
MNCATSRVERGARPGICELAQEEADRGGTHLAAGLGHGSETGREEVGPLKVVEGDQGHLVRNGELRFTKRPHGPIVM